MSRTQEYFKLKYGKIAEPEMYLGETLSMMLLEGGKECWAVLTDQYVKAAVNNVEEILARDGRSLP